MQNLAGEYSMISHILLEVEKIKDLATHLEMSLTNHLGWNSLITYNNILRKIQSIFDSYWLNTLRDNFMNVECLRDARNIIMIKENQIADKLEQTISRIQRNNSKNPQNKPKFY